MVIAMLAIAGWIFDLPLLKSVLRGIVGMKFNTGVCFLLLATSLLILETDTISRRRRITANALAVVALVISSLTYIEHLTGVNLYIDQALIGESAMDIATTAPGRMSMSTSINFLLISLMLLFLLNKKYHRLIQLLSLAIIPFSALVVLKHIFGVSFLDALPQLEYTALNTAICFILLSIGILNSFPLHYLSFSFQVKVAGVMLFITLILSLVFFAIKENQRRFIESAEWVAHTEAILRSSQQILIYAQDIETGTRAYMLSADEKFLEPFHKGAHSIKISFATLKDLTEKNPLQEINLAGLQKSIEENINIRQELIHLVKEKQTASATRIFLTGKTRLAMDRLRSHIDNIQQIEEKLLLVRKSKNHENINNSNRVIVFIQVLSFALILIAFVVIYNNTLSRNKATHALTRSERLIRGIIDSTPNIISIRDMSGKYMMVNKKLEHILNEKEENVIGKSPYDFLPPELANGLIETDKKVKTLGRLLMNEMKLETREKTLFFLNSQFPLYDQHNNMYAVCSVATDVTELKMAQAALEASNRKREKLLNGLQTLLDTSLNVICLLDENGNFIQVSESSEKLWGYTPSEMVGRKYTDFVFQEDQAATRNSGYEIMSGTPITGFENRYRHKNGKLISVSWLVKRSSEDRVIYAIARDATEKRQTMAELAKKEAMLAYAQKLSKIGSWDLNLQNNEYYWSEEMYNITGIPLNGKNIKHHDFLNLVHSEDKDIVSTTMEKAIRHAKAFDIEYRIVLADGSIKYLEGKGNPVLNVMDHSPGLSGTIQDITQRKQSELLLKGLNESLNKRAAALLASNNELEQFAYVASHDLQEPLRMVSSFLRLLEEKYAGALDEAGKKYIHFAVDGSERMKKLIQDLLEFSRISSKKGTMESINCNEITDNILTIYQVTIAELNAAIDVKRLPAIMGVRPQIQQLFQNLIGNALKYHGQKPVSIEVGYKELDEEFEFYIKDNGTGIQPKFFEKIFVIFQRLHNMSEISGTGIGLAVCKKIVEKHNGRIWVESEPGNGSSFYFTIPK